MLLLEPSLAVQDHISPWNIPVAFHLSPETEAGHHSDALTNEVLPTHLQTICHDYFEVIVCKLSRPKAWHC